MSIAMRGKSVGWRALIAMALALLVLAPGAAVAAAGHGGGGGHAGGFGGGHAFNGHHGFVGHPGFHGHPGFVHRFRGGPFIGFGYPYYPYYGAYPTYDAPPTYWYCPTYGGYYPDVATCPDNWIAVPAS